MSFVEKADIRKRPGRYQSDFIWNTDWQSQLDREAAEGIKRKKAKETSPERQTGGLGLSRLQALNSMDVDLSEHLKRRRIDPVAKVKDSSIGIPAHKIKPTQAESRRWERSGKFSTRAAALPLNEEETLASIAAAEKASYETLKLELQLWTLAASVTGFSAAWFAYSKDTAISYAVGAAGSFLYLRMLNRSIDSVAGGGIGGALGQPRLLIPIALALGYNRWNQLKAEESGVVLQLLPMLLGFFTYKAAVVGKQAATLLGELASAPRRGQQNTGQ